MKIYVMYVKGSLKDTYIYVNSIVKTEGFKTLRYKMISDFIIQSFIFLQSSIVWVHLPIESLRIIMLISNKQGGFILWIEKL